MSAEIEDLKRELRRVREERDALAQAASGSSCALFELASRRGDDVPRLSSDLNQARATLAAVKRAIDNS